LGIDILGTSVWAQGRSEEAQQEAKSKESPH
jgi:hypothetical protein